MVKSCQNWVEKLSELGRKVVNFREFTDFKIFDNFVNLTRFKAFCPKVIARNDRSEGGGHGGQTLYPVNPAGPGDPWIKAGLANKRYVDG